MPAEAIPLIKKIHRGHKGDRDDMQTVWRMAWRQRDASLRSFKQKWRPLILLAREIANPTHTPQANSHAPKYCHDEDPWHVQNG